MHSLTTNVIHMLKIYGVIMRWVNIK